MSYKKVIHGFKVEGTLVDKTDGNSYNLSNYIIDIMVRKRYIEDVFPLFVLDFRLTQELRNRLRDDEYLIDLKISYFENSDDGDSSIKDTSDIAEAGIVYQGTIRPYITPYDTTYSKKDEESESAEGVETSAPLVFYRVSGIPDSLIGLNENALNIIYKNSNLSTSLVNIISSTVTNLKCSIQQPTNTKLYKNILIPPLSLVKAINYLDTYYGIYNTPASLFIDTDKLYLYDSLSKDIPLENTIEYNIKSTEDTSNMSDIGSVTMDDENNIRIYSRIAPSINNNKKVVSHTVGSDAIYYSYDSNFNIIKRSSGNPNSYNKFRYFWNNKLDYGFETKDVLLSNAYTSITLSLSNVNPQVITPYTKLKIISQDYPDIQGEYTIASLSYMMSSGNLNEYSDTISITAIKKVNSN